LSPSGDQYRATLPSSLNHDASQALSTAQHRASTISTLVKNSRTTTSRTASQHATASRPSAIVPSRTGQPSTTKAPGRHTPSTVAMISRVATTTSTIHHWLRCSPGDPRILLPSG
jgi:hypothetical protein